MLLFVLAIGALGAATGYVIGELTLGRGPSGAVASGIVGLLLGAALWSTRRGQAPPPEVSDVARGRAGADKARRSSKITGKER